MSKAFPLVAGAAAVGLALYVFVWRRLVNSFDEQERLVRGKPAGEPVGESTS